MRKTEEIVSWVVYRMTIRGKAQGAIAICGQSEWEALELAQPGYHTLVQEGITSEVEAEKLARSQPGCEIAPAVRLKARS